MSIKSEMILKMSNMHRISVFDQKDVYSEIPLENQIRCCQAQAKERRMTGNPKETLKAPYHCVLNHGDMLRCIRANLME